MPEPTGAYAALCDRCHILDGRLPGRPVTAGCVHEHLVTLSLCGAHEADSRARLLWCRPCAEYGYQVPVTVLTAPVGNGDDEMRTHE